MEYQCTWNWGGHFHCIGVAVMFFISDGEPAACCKTHSMNIDESLVGSEVTKEEYIVHLTHTE